MIISKETIKEAVNSIIKNAKERVSTFEEISFMTNGAVENTSVLLIASELNINIKDKEALDCIREGYDHCSLTIMQALNKYPFSNKFKSMGAV